MLTEAPTQPSLRRGLVLGVGTALLGVLEVFDRLVPDERGAALLLVLLLALATGFSPVRPGIGLALTWALALVQVATGVDGLVVEACVVIVLFHAGRWGTVATMWVAGASVPCVLALAALHVRLHGTSLMAVINLSAMARPTSRPQLIVGLTFFLLLLVPWLLGITLRQRAAARINLSERIAAEARSAVAETRRAEAEELARVKDEQARLVRDLHDVVGHSMAVILAQAQSAEFVPEDDPARVKEILRTIATAARDSLGDMGRVLSDNLDPDTVRLDALLASLDRAGRDVRHDVVGAPPPLPPELAVAAYRVLQEMTTNALKHGDPASPINVTVDWTQPELRLEVVNHVAPAHERDPVGSGRGLNGMRSRLDAVGGRLLADSAGGTYTATAWLPLPAPVLLGDPR